MNCRYGKKDSTLKKARHKGAIFMASKDQDYLSDIKRKIITFFLNFNKMNLESSHLQDKA